MGRAHVGPAELGFVRTCLLDWHNLFRRTDHTGMEDGLRECYERLDDLLARGLSLGH